MSKSHCPDYQSWMDHGVNITQCLEYYKGQCGAELSPHYQQACPWPHGYPCPADTGEGRWAPPAKEAS